MPNKDHPTMDPAQITHLLSATGADAVGAVTPVQSLWGGFGELRHVELIGSKFASVMVKVVIPPTQENHPRGWSSDMSYQRKLRSYEIEYLWYKQYSQRCTANCKVPRSYWLDKAEDAELSSREMFLVMEDLSLEYPICPPSISNDQAGVVITWLANFHAVYMGDAGQGLWPIGTYWHLETRPDEYDALPDQELKRAAHVIDQRLNQCQFQTLVHGDAKLANFCFSDNGQRVAGVDFQYVGRGCGMKDVIYFLSSCLDEHQFETQAPELLNVYFSVLEKALVTQKIQINFDELEREWRQLYTFAWADFHRFIAGWSPNHWKVNKYMQQQSRAAIKMLGLS